MLTLTSPVETSFHRLPAGPKLIALCGATVGLFWLDNVYGLGLALAGALALVGLGGGRFVRHAVVMLRPLVPFVVIVGVWHLVTHDLAAGAAILLRLAAAMLLANLVTMTTRLSDMIEVLTRVAAPLRHIGVPPRSLAMVLALTLRFIPHLSDRMAQISESWRARSSRRAGWRVLVPVTLAALDDAEQVAQALQARGGAG